MAGTEGKKGWEKEGMKKERRELNIRTFLIHWHRLFYTYFTHPWFIPVLLSFDGISMAASYSMRAVAPELRSPGSIVWYLSCFQCLPLRGALL